MKQKIKWVNFLHIYQPSWQDPEMVKKVTDESYRFLVNSFKENPLFHGTMNIAGTLLNTLAKSDDSSIVDEIKTLLKNGQIELTGSSHYHAFLPQLPKREIARQIELQEVTLKKYFAPIKLRGFFLPEMAYNPMVGEIIKGMGYEWIILDPISTRTTPNVETKYRDRRTGLTIVFRNRKLSRSYPPEEIYKLLKTDERPTLITATDGEMYGHFHKDWQEHLKQILKSDSIESQTVSDYISSLKQIESVRLRSASWETRAKQIRTNNPFSIWYNRSNPIHRRLWQLADLAMKLVEIHKRDPNFIWARRHLDRGLASCSWWWASEIKTSVFAPLAWSPDEILKGATELIKSIRSLERLSREEKMKAEKIFLSLSYNVWIKHWNTYGYKS